MSGELHDFVVLLPKKEASASSSRQPPYYRLGASRAGLNIVDETKSRPLSGTLLRYLGGTDHSFGTSNRVESSPIKRAKILQSAASMRLLTMFACAFAYTLAGSSRVLQSQKC